MNFSLIRSCMVMESVEEKTLVDKWLLLEDKSFNDLFKKLINEGRQDMHQMTDTLSDYVNSNY